MIISSGLGSSLVVRKGRQRVSFAVLRRPALSSVLAVISSSSSQLMAEG
jgi:hypothetical protein